MGSLWWSKIWVTDLGLNKNVHFSLEMMLPNFKCVGSIFWPVLCGLGSMWVPRPGCRRRASSALCSGAGRSWTTWGLRWNWPRWPSVTDWTKVQCPDLHCEEQLSGAASVFHKMAPCVGVFLRRTLIHRIHTGRRNSFVSLKERSINIQNAHK